MNTYIGVWPSWFPFPLTIICAIVIYGPSLILAQVVENSAPAVAAILLTLLVFVHVMIYRFIVHILTVPTTTKQKFYGWIDGFISLTHVWAGFAMSIAILAPSVDTHFTVIPPGTKGYDLFWTYCYTNTVLLFVTIGQKIVGVTALGALPAVFTAVSGVMWIAFFATLVLRQVYIPPHKTKEKPIGTAAQSYAVPAQRTRQGPRPRGGRPLVYRTQQQQQPSTSSIYTSFTPDYSKINN